VPPAPATFCARRQYKHDKNGRGYTHSQGMARVSVNSILDSASARIVALSFPQIHYRPDTVAKDPGSVSGPYGERQSFGLWDFTVVAVLPQSTAQDAVHSGIGNRCQTLAKCRATYDDACRSLVWRRSMFPALAMSPATLRKRVRRVYGAAYPRDSFRVVRAEGVPIPPPQRDRYVCLAPLCRIGYNRKHSNENE